MEQEGRPAARPPQPVGRTGNAAGNQALSLGEKVGLLGFASPILPPMRGLISSPQGTSQAKWSHLTPARSG